MFTNTVTGLRDIETATIKYLSDAGGTGGGSALPDLRVLKAAVNEPAPREYDVEVSCVLEGRTTRYSVAASTSTPGLVRDLEIGSVCTVTELDTFGAEVSYSPSQTITIADNAEHLVELTVTNTFAPPTPLGAFSLAKLLEGPAGVVDPAVRFPVEYTVTTGGVAAAAVVVNLEPGAAPTVVTSRWVRPSRSGSSTSPRCRSGTPGARRRSPPTRSPSPRRARSASRRSRARIPCLLLLSAPRPWRSP